MNPIQSIGPSRVSPVFPCYIIDDGSFSMTSEMDDGLSRFEHAKEVLRKVIEQMRKSSMLYDMMELCIIICRGDKPAVVLQPTKLCDVDVDGLVASIGEPEGCTPMGQSIIEALRLADERKAELAASGTPYIQPLVTLLTDGIPTDPADVMDRAVDMVNQRQRDKKLCFIACGIADDDPRMIPILKRMCSEGADPLHIKQADNFTEYIRLLNKTARTMQNQIVRPDYKVTPISSFPMTAAL